MNNRSYHQFCTLAYALDAVGERWTLLIIRELLAGPRRFTDLLNGLPGISTNLLSERLKGMEQQGLLYRRVLPPPAGSTVYMLTPIGLSLENAVLELGKWGCQFLPASPDRVALPSLGAMALAIQAFFHPEEARGMTETFQLHLGNEVLQVRVKQGEVDVRQGETRKADVFFHTEMQCFVRLFAGQISPEEAITAGLVRIEGDRREDGLNALRRFLRICSVPGAEVN
jgi:DNA-binding HxlR family transcriptional regulator/putative sterol carrier protein